MKLFKTVIILSLAIVSLSSSVAFGDNSSGGCDLSKINDTQVTGSKTAASQSGSVNNGGQQSQAGQTQ